MFRTVSYDAINGMMMTMECENSNEAWCYVLNKLEIKDNLNIYTF